MDEPIEELLPFYVLGVLEEADRARVEQYLAATPSARQQVEAMQRAADSLAYGAPPAAPPESARQALLERLAAQESGSARVDLPPVPALPQERARERVQKRPQARRPRLRVPAGFFAGLSLALVALAGVWILALNAQVARLRADVVALQADVRQQSAGLALLNNVLAQPSPQALRSIPLQGTEAHPQAAGQLITDLDSRTAILVVSGLEPLPPGRTYQAWLIRGETPFSAGLLPVGTGGQGVIVLSVSDAIGAFDSLGVSIEPEGGSLAPSGEIVILSEIS
jgi:anti-sigma-K factor RskA